jgi:hypothetical protein
MEDRGKSMTTASGRKQMKKLFFLLCLTALLTASCVITPKAKVVYDESIAVEKTAWICPGNIGAVIGYNGIEVNWKFTPLSFTFIQIPAGNTLLEWNIDTSTGNTILKANNILFRYNFLQGKQYLFLLGYDPKENENGSLGLKVYMYDIGENVNGTYGEMEKHYYGFAPFLNYDSKRRTILE